MNNKTLTIVSIALIICTVLLFTLQLSNRKIGSSQTSISNTQNHNLSVNKSSLMSVAYVNLDSVMLKYDYYKKLDEETGAKQMNAQKQLQSKMQMLESDYMSVQEKAQKGLMTRKEIADAEQNFQFRQQELVNLQQKMSGELQQEEQKLQLMLADTVKNVIKEFNKNAGYQVILNNTLGSTVLYAENQMNITDTIIYILNKRYNKK